MSKIKLLLVDDEEDYARTLAERLSMRDVASQVALSGEEAMKAVEEDEPHVMVLDLRMPGIDGMAVLERVKKEHPHVQVIVLTGHGSEQAEKEALRLGAYRYMEKPADTAQLLKTIRSAWKRALKMLKDSGKEFEGHMMAAALAEGGGRELALDHLEETREQEQEEEEETEAEPPAGPARALNVLFVDDEEDFVRALAERMEMRDLGGEVALDGQAALAMLEEEEPPDVMVLDLRMPGLDGLEVLRRVKRLYPGVEVVILTGHGSEQDEEEARRLGTFEYLRKPVDIEVLMDAVRRAGQRAAERAGDEGDASGNQE